MTHRYGSNSEAASDVGLRVAGVQEREARQSTFFEGGGTPMALCPSAHAERQRDPG